ncbi:TPA: outer membrane beta-barrel protein [Legionella pneumophila]|nr:outer membrane beta-barrel protein [Legionella pneumophila]
MDKILYDRLFNYMNFQPIFMNFIKFYLICGMVGFSSSLVATTAPLIPWTGFYAGINGGYSNIHNKSHTNLSTIQILPSPLSSPALAAATSVNSGTFSLSSNNQGFIGGGQIGYLYSLSQLAVGLETDIQGISSGASEISAIQIAAIPTFRTSKIASNLVFVQNLDYLGTIRGRLGIWVTPSLLLAATGGYAYGDVRLNTYLTQSYLGTANNLVRSFSSEGSYSSTQNGWVAGGSLEWRAQERWITKLEYLYYDLSSITYNSTLLVSLINGGANAGQSLFVNAVSTTSRFNGQIIRLGINYLFA